MSSDIAIRVNNLSKRYALQHTVKDEKGNDTNELWALKDVSFEVKKGESVGIIGPNGSGKSTLLKILAGVSKPTSGRVEIRGRVASILDIGAGFHPELSGRENVFLNGQILGFGKKEIKVKHDEIVDFSGIEKFIDEPVKTYSNGMYLRLAFSIMAHLDFDVYLFDEVMSVGDAEFALKTKTKFQQLMSSQKTVLLVSHNLTELDNQDIFILLESGMVRQITRKKNILSDYIERTIRKGEIEIITKPLEITDFSEYENSEDIKITKLLFYQDDISTTESFRTNKPFVIEIEYEKLKENDTIDVVISIADHQDNMILSSSPFISGNFSDRTAKGKVVSKCFIPPDFFNSQVYRISLFFLRNCKKNIMEATQSLDPDIVYKDDSIVTLRLAGIIVFKPMFFKGSKPIDLTSINLRGHLLTGFDWK